MEAIDNNNYRQTVYLTITGILLPTEAHNLPIKRVISNHKITTYPKKGKCYPT